jgi:hypothetical protein
VGPGGLPLRQEQNCEWILGFCFFLTIALSILLLPSNLFRRISVFSNYVCFFFFIFFSNLRKYLYKQIQFSSFIFSFFSSLLSSLHSC